MAETKVIELDVKTNLGSLKSQLKQAQAEVQNLADKFGATSAQAIEAAKKPGIKLILESYKTSFIGLDLFIMLAMELT